MITAYIGVGSNIDRKKHIETAIVELSRIGEELQISTIYECEAVGFKSEPFYNLVVKMKTALEVTEFSHALRKIELKWGRREDAAKFEARTLDLDIILFGELVSEHQPQIPRDDIYKFAFVIQPLNELCPQLVVPGDGRTIQQIFTSTDYPEVLTMVKPWFF
ncbi:2-amino-4-hydroxy-6-hydroxymethyldihydropteridine diphosphokinase [Vibrio scophthalmi]|uniref:2-amino-4-hydroxy-6-hydroxymethyldihydropteridine diphosphokinase n=1 Tax=Vibrio scophthalmi TaxID=45658 RepID=A0A1E3WRS1_9VIBR|nr:MULTISPECIES: 2-amino-4-hydroxy-6-hydroxymethyldihydropteridine diphosphokinase [Vibrio]EGU30565.1 2-amino-4-hydroxy-6-hydroxymethyldihydropteridine pyrophosphokinase [Vibrio sp. N418]MCY9804675.1 2-amino-4-hydroxy-6-hydroxymethyldihydropteridine diphosphokinase [Vibrio scophthalmi]ODS12454.1 2-amino-4-hydroxy-6-hydroxymethyldihydropteridine diphosphokinase [Vibrio scophthalmi]